MRRRDSRFRRALVLRADDLGRRVVRGAGFQFLGIGLRTVITIGSVAVLARLLTPADFGYVAMATVVTEFAALFANFGLNAMLVQRRRITRLQADTVFWASACIGCGLAALVWALSWVVHLWFAEPLVGELLRWMAVVFVLSGLNVVPGVILARLLMFRLEFWINISTVVIRTVAAILAAWLGLGVWSLVVGALVGAVVQLMLSYGVAPFRPRARFHSNYLKGTWRTSSSYFGSGMLFYVNMNVDLLLIGRSLGATSLGYYQTARSLTDEIRARLAMPLQQVLFPAFSSLQGDRERMRQAVLRSARLIAAVLFPVGVCVAATAAELVRVLYGPQWGAMTPLISLFGLSAALKASTAIAAPIFNASDRVGLSLRYNAISSVMLVSAVLLTMPHGIEAVAAAVVGVSLYSLVPFRIALGLIGLGWRAVVAIIGPPAVASVVLWLVVIGMRSWLEPMALNASVGLLLLGCCGLLSYTAALMLISRDYVAEVGRVAAKLKGRQVKA